MTLDDVRPFSMRIGTSSPWVKYTWDAENRLTAVTPAAPVAGSLKAEYKYDYLGRRVEKSVSTWNTGTSSWDLTSRRRFVWAGEGTGGWLLLAELDGLDENAVVRTYTWGLDLAGLNGSMGGVGVSPAELATAGADLESAGGIGGLLAMHDPNDPNDPNDADREFAVLYDANGNVTQLVAWAEDYAGTADYAWDTATPALARLAARYEYDPYGNLTASAGEYAEENPWRFSTKQWDDETGLGYWGKRYYDPAQGRWISRDPIEEQGGASFYEYVANGPCDHIDGWGLKITLAGPTEMGTMDVQAYLKGYGEKDIIKLGSIRYGPGGQWTSTGNIASKAALMLPGCRWLCLETWYWEIDTTVTISYRRFTADGRLLKRFPRLQGAMDSATELVIAHERQHYQMFVDMNRPFVSVGVGTACSPDKACDIAKDAARFMADRIIDEQTETWRTRDRDWDGPDTKRMNRQIEALIKGAVDEP